MFARILLAVGVASVLSGCATVYPGEAAIRFRPYRKAQSASVLPEGRYAKAPWNSIIVYDVRWQTHSEKTDIQTSDRLHMSAKTAIAYRPSRERLYELNKTLGADFYRTTIQPLFVAAIRAEFAKRPHDQIIPDATAIQEGILESIRKKIADQPIEILRVTIDDVDFPPEVAQSVAREATLQQEMKNQDVALQVARRESQVAVEKAKGASQSRLASQEAEAAIAAKEAEVAAIRAHSEAEVAKIRAAQLTPMYLRFRSIEMLEAVGKSGGNKIYVVPSGKDGLPLFLNPE